MVKNAQKKRNTSLRCGKMWPHKKSIWICTSDTLNIFNHTITKKNIAIVYLVDIFIFKFKSFNPAKNICSCHYVFQALNYNNITNVPTIHIKINFYRVKIKKIIVENNKKYCFSELLITLF